MRHLAHAGQNVPQGQAAVVACKEFFADFHGVLVFILAVQVCDDLARQGLLGGALLRVGCLLGLQGLDLFAGEEGEAFQVADDAGVVRVQQELVELVAARLLLVQPQGIPFALAELVALRVRHKRHGQGIHLIPRGLADELDTGGDVAPLVAARHLQVNAAGLMQVLEVDGLDEHVRELCVGDAAFHLPAHMVLGEHVAHVDVLAELAEVVDDRHLADPVIIVDYLEAEELLHLLLEALVIAHHLLALFQLALYRAARIADEAGRHAHQQQRLVPCRRQPPRDQEAGVMPQVQAVRRRIRADVEGHPPGVQLVLQFRAGYLVNQPSPFQVFV